ncbi:nuclear transport factor 2 family protein [Dietzia sp. B32]|uniref:nuclear transport factor 2 family protein n=1 Tax=Dietzia sp. B32 TaxID=2915130 RepID=UPI0021AD8FDE|nr:nuclear transport factor 2 family protein [Dietzia sp. B32]UVE96898.1 nuclear transport factor 2 family protein [Dietzia sp. B32]
MAQLSETDRWEIFTLGSRYAHALDRRDWAQLAMVFSEDAVMEFAGLPSATGPEAIGRVCARALAPLEGSQHLVGSPLVEFGAEFHSVSYYFHAQHVRIIDGDLALFTVAGGYDDRVERRTEGWRIVHRRQTVSWSSGDPRVMEGVD